MIMAPQVLKNDSFFEKIVKRFLVLKENLVSGRFYDKYYVLAQVIIWMLVSSITTYFLIKMQILNI